MALQNFPIETARLVASDGAAGDDLGASVAIAADTVAAGAPFGEAVYVFERTASGWPAFETDKLVASDGLGADSFGVSVAMKADTIVSGARHGRVDGLEPGAVYVFERTTAGWPATETAKLVPSDNTRELGVSVAIASDADTIVAGAFRDALSGNEEQGAVYVFERALQGWPANETAKLTASDGAEGDELGLSVAVTDDGRAVFAGAFTGRDEIYVFERTPAGWPATETAKVTIADGPAGLGFSVAVDGDTLAGGAPGAAIDGNANQGAVYVFGGFTDSDNDGIPDVSDPDTVAAIVAALPASAFARPGLPTALLSRLDDIEASIADWYAAGDTGARDQAIRELRNLRRRVDGCGGVPDANDWIVDCAAQLDVRSALDAIIATLTAA